MNCEQARTLLSAYRELNCEEIDTAELDAHLETCAACREALASYARMGEQVRAAPTFVPPPEMHTKLLKALADEQLKFLQKSAPGKVLTPEFLKPYLQERAEEAQNQDDIAAFSTAETGPLPFIQTKRKRRPIRVNQFAVLGMAAAILMLLMIGGLTSLLMLARSNPPQLAKTITSVIRPAEVDQKVYTAKTPYTSVTSALPEGNSIYYSAAENGENGEDWMLLQFDRGTQTSTPLLDTPSTDPLIVLAVSQHWLVWLQYSNPPTITHGPIPGVSANNMYSTPQRAWSLHYLSLWPQPQDTTGTPASTAGSGKGAPASTAGTTTDQSATTDTSDIPTSLLLEQGIFDRSTAPAWITTPVQGAWLDGDQLLVTQTDQHGVSRLESYPLGQTGKAAKAQVIAKAPAGHVFAWPATNSNGMEIYWADEWVTPDGVLHSNVWQQQTNERLESFHGRVEEAATNTQQVYLGGGMSFQPQIVNDTLFVLSTSEIRVSAQGVVTPNGTPFPVSATDTSVLSTPRTDTSVYAASPDASVHGTIFMIPLAGQDIGTKDTLGTAGQSTGLQAGNGYVIWQDNEGYQMYDVLHQSDVTLGTVLNGASMLAVNGNTTLWFTGESKPGFSVTMMAFNWPD